MPNSLDRIEQENCFNDVTIINREGDVLYKTGQDEKAFIETLSELKKKYQSKIDIHIGLETVYFPFFDKDGYYKELKAKENLEINEASKKQKNHFWKDFWDKAGAAQIIHGVDAHALSEVKVI